MSYADMPRDMHAAHAYSMLARAILHDAAFRVMRQRRCCSSMFHGFTLR